MVTIPFKGASVDTGWLMNSTCFFPKVADVALDRTGRRFVQLFLSYQHWKISLVAFGMRKVDISRLPSAPRAGPSIMGNREEQHIYLIRKRER